MMKKHKFIFRLHFVVQKENYHEMEDIVQLGKKYGADHVWLDKIQDWNVMQNFQKHIFQRTNCCLGGTCFTLTRKLSEQTLIRASTTLSGLKKMLFV